MVMMTDEEEEKEVSGTKIQRRWERMRPPWRRPGRLPGSRRELGGRFPGPLLETRCRRGHRIYRRRSATSPAVLNSVSEPKLRTKTHQSLRKLHTHEWCKALGGSRPSSHQEETPRPCSAPPLPRPQHCSPEVAKKG